MRDEIVAAPAARVRAAIARAWLERDGARPTRGDGRGAAAVASCRALGAITLRPHQIEAAHRLASAFDEFGGALLADEVGLGKTYTALALAACVASHPLVVAPAALRDMWRAALDATGVRAPIVSFERLSRAGGAVPDGERFDFVLVDEAHHARNPATRRYRALARIAARARVLLLTATPVHNRRADLDALLALFLGGRAHALDDRDLARVVVRRGRGALAAAGADPAEAPPAVAPLRWLRPPADDAVLDALLALPPPLPPRDGGDGGGLVVHGLVRQWASSDAALRAAVARRLAASVALDDALRRGRHPTRGDLRAWVAGADAVQLAFAELLVSDDAIENGAELLDTVRRHERALHELDARLRASAARTDAARAALLGGVVTRHRGEKIVAFASYAETVAALFGRLLSTARVAALGRGGAMVAGGCISRREALARFAPDAAGVRPPRAADRVDLLLATDVLSEGVNLQDASVVVHLDLPWTPARLEQRVGRAARLGARHREVTVYAMAPPATAERVLAVEARLREKARVAGAAVGRELGAPFLLDASPAMVRSAPGDSERVRDAMRRWVGEDASGASDTVARGEALLVAAVRAPRDGFLALCDVGRASEDGARDARVLVASFAAAPPSDRPSALCDAVACADGGDDVAVDRARTEAALAAVAGWALARAAATDAGVGDAVGAGGVAARRRVLDRIAAAARRVPLFRRAAVAMLCGEARRAALLPMGAAAEWELAELARSMLPDEAWLTALAAFARDHERGGSETSGAAASPFAAARPRAILHFVADL